MNSLRVGYVPYSDSLDSPGDKRRFVAYAKEKKIIFEIANENEKYDLVILTETADITKWNNYPHGKIVYDLIDSYLDETRFSLKSIFRGVYKYLSGSHKRFEPIYKNSIIKMCKHSDAIVCTTEDQKKTISKYNSNVSIILDSHSSVVKDIKKQYTSTDIIKVVWEGLPSNIDMLTSICGVLHKYKNQIQLNVVTDSTMPRSIKMLGDINIVRIIKKKFPNSIFHNWSADTLSSIVTKCDFAIIPIDLSNSFVSGKPENKLLLFWKMGVPVVTSRTKSYKAAMDKAGVDLTCSNLEDWDLLLSRMINSENLRRESAKKGLRYAESMSDQSLFKLWDEVFLSLGFKF